MNSLTTVEKAPESLWGEVMSSLEEHNKSIEGIVAVQDVYLKASNLGLQMLSLSGRNEASADRSNAGSSSAQEGLLKDARRQLSEYFKGERAVFQLPLDLSSVSPFARDVLKAAADIPYGKVRSYKWITESIDRPNAFRAVGRTLHKNPLPIVISCHRVVRSDGGLGGYVLGEELKNRLLTMEQEISPYVGCSTTRILCYRGCPHGRRVLEGNRVHFTGLEEGLESGYRPCKVCRPV